MNYKQCKASGGVWKNNKCDIVIQNKMKVSIKPARHNKRILAMIIVIIFLGISTLLQVNFATMVHEYAGHNLAAHLFGCSVDSSAEIYTGHTSFENCIMEDNHIVNIMIALSSIFIVYFIALGLWLFAGKDSLWRVLATFMFMYSSIPSAFPLMQGSDMAYAVYQGLPYFVAWGIYLLMAGVFLWQLTDEIVDKPIIETFWIFT